MSSSHSSEKASKNYTNSFSRALNDPERLCRALKTRLRKYFSAKFELCHNYATRALTNTTVHRKLERERTIHSLPLKDEREILRQIHKCERIKGSIIEFQDYDHKIKQTKVIHEHSLSTTVIRALTISVQRKTKPRVTFQRLTLRVTPTGTTQRISWSLQGH